MSIYQEILNWSQNRPNFIRDALRRTICNPTITQTDINELILLLKKENDDTTVTIDALPIDITHIPTTINSGAIYPKLISIKNPINICALYNKAHLQFSNNGLTAVYGNNGSGKSSYSRILKKLCWSRNPGIELKRNVFTPSPNQQQVEFLVQVNGLNTSFQWSENLPTHPSLSSIYIFDNDCGDVYINKENPTEYKPTGIDVLERLISILTNMSQNLSHEISRYNTQKPRLDPPLNSTNSGQWYANFEILSRVDVDSYIQFSEADSTRKQEVFNLLSTQNPQQNISNLRNLKNRIENYEQQFRNIEEFFNDQSIDDLKLLRNRYESTKQAYEIATAELSSVNTIEGFGSDPWRTLWEAAKNFAHSNGMSDGQSFPSSASLEKCVLCQQELDEVAQQRLQSFNQFILNDVSTQRSSLQNEIQRRVSTYTSLTVPPFENFTELTNYITDFQSQHSTFTECINFLKQSVINYLQTGGEIVISLNKVSSIINSLIPTIDRQLEEQNQLLQNRNALVIEFNELTAREFLWNEKANILQYVDEVKYKNWINRCQSQLNTSIVSRKIGELMEDQAVNLQHQEFVNHLRFFNQDLASKVLLSKTRTTQGSTYQKCGLNGIADSINSVLSEGEQKIIALSNFLAECTIDGRKNSVIFDDPVTSLDMDYRDLIAKKIVELSRDRQIVVLTHDLSFLRLLLDTHNEIIPYPCHIIGIDKYNGISGIVTDEIPYLVKNVQERIDSIKRILTDHDALSIADAHGKETKLDSARKRFRMLLERSVEEILSNKTYERFSKNIHLKKGNLSSYIVTEQSDVDFLLNLFGKYSITEHDGGTSTIPLLPSKTVIEQDIRDYSTWKDSFKTKLSAFKASYN
ncbi:AAA family ATPase [Flavobacterium sp.]|uniref:AAA family ATPase n=1 Tax=Flavobacterium sp. TaxID=239 RepID=UPI004034EF4E